MFKKFILSTLMCALSIQPCIQAEGTAETFVQEAGKPVIALTTPAFVNEAGKSVASVCTAITTSAQTVVDETGQVVVPLYMALHNVGGAVVNGAIATGRILWITAKLGAKGVCLLSEGCMRVARFGGEHPEFVAGVAVGTGGAYLVHKFNKWQKQDNLNQASRMVRTGNNIRAGRPVN